MFPRVPYTSADVTTADTTVQTTNDDALSLMTDPDWWANAIEDDSFFSPMPLDASENGLWNGKFVPPPPRPPFLEETVSSDGLTTCDLCTWAWHDRTNYSLDGSIETAGELGWTFTLIIVSVISALLGAIIMIIVLRCRRLKSSNSNGNRPVPWWYRSTRTNSASNRTNITSKHPADHVRGSQNNNSGVWTWLTQRRPPTTPDQLGTPQHQSPAENHYTHMDDTYSPVNVGEALYAELDRESIHSGNPSYQNTAYSQCGEVNYADQDIPMVSSAPSSAYYSDLSVTAVPTERAYEVVGLTMMSSALPNWEQTAENSFSIVSGSNSGHNEGSGVDASGTATTTNLGMSSANSMNCGTTVNMLPGQTSLHHHHHHHHGGGGGGVGGNSNILISPAASGGTGGGGSSKKSARLSAINESASIPSDYV